MVHESQARQRLAARLLVHGRVQGVGYRFFAQALAASLGLRGWVRNLPDGDVEAYAEGPRSTIEMFARRLEEGPSLASVEEVGVTWSSPENRCASFSIIS